MLAEPSAPRGRDASVGPPSEKAWLGGADGHKAGLYARGAGG